jgi:thiamine monophosphate synthase
MNSSYYGICIIDPQTEVTSYDELQRQLYLAIGGDLSYLEQLVKSKCSIVKLRHTDEHQQKAEELLQTLKTLYRRQSEI